MVRRDAFANGARVAGYLASVAQYYGSATPLGNVAPALYSVFDANGFTANFADLIVGDIGTINGIPVGPNRGAIWPRASVRSVAAMR